jgi:hypothetical protein
MAKTGRNVAVALAAVGALIGTSRASAAADAEVPTNTIRTSSSHVRSANPAIVSLIAQATERSATFRRLVEDIDASDSYVYVNEGKCGHGVRACFVSVTASKANRYMRVVVDTKKADWDLMGSIGHELRHTIEVIGNPQVRDNTAKYFFYEQIGSQGTGAGARETQAAADAGNQVRSEVRKFNREATSE